MSGIAGLLALDGQPIERSALSSMIAALAHRGPDGQYLWSEGPVGLAHAAFANGPESALAPDLYDDGDLVVTADVRLDNRDELAANLRLNARETSDPQLLCAAYRRWGRECAVHLLGDFAFALWDRRERRLFCTRDHFGVKPLYYYVNSLQFAFGSEIKAILKSRIDGIQAREEAIGDYLSSTPPEPGATFYAGVFTLLPGHWLSVQDDRIDIVEYWSLKIGRVALSTSPIEDFLAVFNQAVARRTRSSRTVGALLSGGLDSSSIVRFAAPQSVSLLGKPLPTISVVFDKTPQWSERPFIESVLAQGDCDPSFISVEDYAPFKTLELSLDEQDGPFFAPGLELSRGMHQRARDLNIAVLLDGHGGDETVSHGFGRIEDLAAARNWPKLWSEMHGIAHIYGEAAYVRFLQLFLINSQLRRPTQMVRRMIQRVRRSGSDPLIPPWAEFINRDFARRTGLAERRAELTPPAARGEQAQHLADLVSTNCASAFEMLDHQSAARGVEIRYPFWDKDLVDLCLNLPSAEKLDGGWSRLILRRAMEGRLPKDVQWRRTKLDFSPHLILGMLNHHTDLIEDVILSDSGGIGGYVDLAAVENAWRRMQALREGVSPSDMFGIYRVVVLSEWNRKHLLNS